MSNATPSPRIGPVMAEIIAYVARHPGCTKLSAAMHSGPGPRAPRNMRRAYAPVDRAILAGFIRAEQINTSKYALYTNTEDT